MRRGGLIICKVFIKQDDQILRQARFARRLLAAARQRLSGIIAQQVVQPPAAGVLFYAGLILFHSREALLALQLFNAVFIGIVAGIGMLWFQDLMPGRAGSATTLFTNSISTGVILAGVIQGALAQSYGHGSVYWMIAAISVVTLGLTCRVKDV